MNREAQVSGVRTLEDQVDTSLSNERLLAWLSTIFGILAALLAAIGLYGVITYSVARRTREIGLRVALGAGRAQIQWLVMRETLVLIGVGAALFMGAIALVAGVLPAYRATHVDPVTALRCE